MTVSPFHRQAVSRTPVATSLPELLHRAPDCLRGIFVGSDRPGDVGAEPASKLAVHDLLNLANTCPCSELVRISGSYSSGGAPILSSQIGSAALGPAQK